MTLRPTPLGEIPIESPTVFRALATNTTGGVVTRINGWHARPVLRPGTRVLVEGEGFQPWVRTGATRSFIYVAYPVAPDRNANITMTIRAWSDTRIVADLPLNPVLEYGAQDDMRVILTIFALSPDKIGSFLKVPRIRFIV